MRTDRGAFRHACATRLVRKGMQESLIRKQMDLSPNSNMIATYVHLANTDLKTYQMRQSGELSEAVKEVELKPKETVMDTIAGLYEKVDVLRVERKKMQKEIEEHDRIWMKWSQWQSMRHEIPTPWLWQKALKMNYH